MKSEVSAEMVIAPSTDWVCILLTTGMVISGVNGVNMLVAVCKVVMLIALGKRAPEPQPKGVWTGVIIGAVSFTVIGAAIRDTVAVFAGGVVRLWEAAIIALGSSSEASGARACRSTAARNSRDLQAQMPSWYV